MTCIGITILGNCIGKEINGLYLVPIIITIFAVLYLIMLVLNPFGTLTNFSSSLRGVFIVATIVILSWILVYLGVNLSDMFNHAVKAVFG